LKRIAILPTLFTLGNGVCGFAALAYAGRIGLHESNVVSDDFYLALCGWLIIVAMIFDALDGYIARLSRSVTAFGGELDSLCDAVSFGVAPAFLLLRLGPSWELPLLHQMLAVIATLYVVCALLRLARFNVEALQQPAANTGGKRFKGLPSPAAAGCIASLAILRGEIVHRWTMLQPDQVHMIVQGIQAWSMIGGLFVALLMVSRVPYPHLSRYFRSALRRRRPFDHLIFLVLAGFFIALIQELALPILFWGYAVVILALAVRARSQQPELLPVVRTDD
jgi:CDP-diacylglycerol--serine O-phosphatidyltransferase